MNETQKSNGKKSSGNGKIEKKSLGQVSNLERHVDPHWWGKIFNAMYLKTDGDVVEDLKITRKEIDHFMDFLGITLEDRVLDLCCGQGRHTLELARRGLTELDGLDRSHYLIQRAKSLVKKESLPVKFREGDARRLPYSPDTFNHVMILGNSFGYFETEEDDLKVLREVLRVLKPQGKLLIDVADGEYLRDNFQKMSWEWIDKDMFVNRERSLSDNGQRIISREIVTHTQRGILVDQFYAETIYSKEGMRELLQKAGFSSISFVGEMTPDSQRNQDLGMMERRIIVTAEARKEWTKVKMRSIKPREVTVALGDPKKPDPLKPAGVFDEDDIHTINQMKAALKELEQTGRYRFTYVDNHDTLIQDLLKLREKGKLDIVLNLCDEGHDNNPRKELHIPAILETLKIPYTGAGPQCLAFCYDKSLVRGVANEMRIPVPDAYFIKPEDKVYDLQIAFPVIVKPNFGDSSFGITQRSVVYNVEELNDAIVEVRKKFGYNYPMLLEEFLVGKDITVGIIGNPSENYVALPVIEEDYSLLPEGLPKICGYEAKWDPASPYSCLRSVPVELQNGTEKHLVEYCMKLFERLECRDYCRFDWRFDSQGNPKLLEVNPNPGWCWDGHLAKMSNFAGISYSEMLRMIINAAEQRLKLDEIEPAKVHTEISSLQTSKIV